MKKSMLNIPILLIEGFFEFISITYFLIAIINLIDSYRYTEGFKNGMELYDVKELLPTAIGTQAVAGILDKIRKYYILQ